VTQLTGQSIRNLCTNTEVPLISPFLNEKIRVNGASKGLSHASYDASIDHDLTLGRHPGIVWKDWLLRQDFASIRGLWRALRDLPALQSELRNEPPHYALAYTVEDFHLPADVGGAVCDKSTYARVFVSAFNTFFDPGFHGNATLELVNFSEKVVSYKKGDAVCQFIFTWLDADAENPYDGKYQHQTKGAHGARFESAPGIWTEDKDHLAALTKEK
jgi:deoxycytidine triphosphate deaminase